MKPTEHINLCLSSHRRLLRNLASVTDDDVRSPSLLPGWSRGHVITHLANKTKTHIWLFGGPPVGEVRRQHPEGYQQEPDIEAGAHRSATELRSDLMLSFEGLEAAWDALRDGLWDHKGIVTPGPRSMAEIVFRHVRDVETHHVDLDLGYHTSDWPKSYVEGELNKRLRALPDRADHADLLAWLLGRSAAPELSPW
jgi:maleylpyruvate isomerase